MSEVGPHDSAPRILRVDASGVTLSGSRDAVIDVRFGGRRVWSLWSHRDSSPSARGERLAAWPEPLARRLDGVTLVSVVEHGSEHALFEETVAFGDSREPLELVDKLGNELGMDNTGKLVPTFENRSSSDTSPLLDSLEAVLDELTRLGYAAFPAYGTLLGAVREGRLIGHDSDADIGYVSEHTHPFDVIRESFEMQRQLHEAGYPTMRYSAISLKIHVTESDGYKRGLDIFGGFHDGERLNMLGEIRTPYERDWIFPLSTTTLSGRTLPAPARPDKMLEVAYGPGWQTPDPAFAFSTPASTIKTFNAMFRATRARRLSWSKALTAAAGTKHKAPSALAEHVVATDGVPAQLLDLGAGLGIDSLWFARQGTDVTAYDYIHTMPLQRKERRAAKEGHSLSFRRLNLQELRSVFVEGARISRVPGPRVLLANHIFDAVGGFGRESLARFASMALREGGRIHADFWCRGGNRRDGFPLTPVSIDEVTDRLMRQGLDILEAGEVDVPEGSASGRRTGRVVAQWA